MDITNLKYSTPYSCYINLTSKCNLRCKHCFGNYGIVEENELSLMEWKKVVDDMVNSKVFFVNISGGEPTQSQYFKEFISYLTRRGMHFILTTNGVFSKDIRNFLLKNKEYLIGIKISLDGPDARSHCFLRLDARGSYNPAVFKAALKNLYFFKRHKFPITLATVLHTGNIKKIKKMFKLVKRINPVSWFISPIVPIGRGNLNKSDSRFYEFFDIDFWNWLKEYGKECRINVHLVDMPVNTGKEGLSAYECAGALNFCEIHSDGSVSPCSLSRVCIPKNKIMFENIRDMSLEEIWNGKAFERFRSFMNTGCDGCILLSRCNKCIAQSFRYFEDGMHPTPFCIKQGKRIGLKSYEEYQKVLNSQFNLGV